MLPLARTLAEHLGQRTFKNDMHVTRFLNISIVYMCSLYDMVFQTSETRLLFILSDSFWI